MRSCRNELTSKALGQYPPWELLLALASTTVVVYLALGLLVWSPSARLPYSGYWSLADAVQDEVDDCQAHMLCALMLHVSGERNRTCRRSKFDLEPSPRLRKSMVFSLLTTAMTSLCYSIGAILILISRGKVGLALSLPNGQCPRSAYLNSLTQA